MAVIVDLDDEPPAQASSLPFPTVKPLHHSLAAVEIQQDAVAEEHARPNPNFDNGFSAALSCYP
jgi:hypothetical protein